MKRHSVFVVLVALVLLAGCGGSKRKPAVLTDPGARPSPSGAYPPATATPEPEQPIAEGPDTTAIPGGGPTGEDFTPTDASGENGPLEDIRFQYDRAEISDEARATLEKHALWLQNHRTAKVTVEGHCDERGTVDYNIALGDKRARAVKDYLASLGVAGERMQTVSLGKERPLDPASNEQAFAKNRRAHFVVSR
jgi:peptidoglycan-associated lipoprotein